MHNACWSGGTLLRWTAAQEIVGRLADREAQLQNLETIDITLKSRNDSLHFRDNVCCRLGYSVTSAT
jgi:hypothetical protein